MNRRLARLVEVLNLRVQTLESFCSFLLVNYRPFGTNILFSYAIASPSPMSTDTPRTEGDSSTNTMPSSLYNVLPGANAWRPLERLIDSRFGPPPLSELLPDTDEEDEGDEEVQDKASSNQDPPSETLGDEDRQPNSGSLKQHSATDNEKLERPTTPEGMGESFGEIRLLGTSKPEQQLPVTEKSHLTHARRLMVEGARAPSCYVSDNNLDQTPATMTGFDGEVKLWPHQLAAVGRLVQMLTVHLCALLAFDMGLGKTLIIIGMLGPFISPTSRSTDLTTGLLTTMGLCSTKIKGPVLIVVPKGLMAQWLRELKTRLKAPGPKVCVFRK
jgi:hypothetical protein